MPDVIAALFVYAVVFLGVFSALRLHHWIEGRARWRWPKRRRMPRPRRFP